MYFQDDRLELLQNLYVSNVKNRLRELESPTEELQKRWIWELIQNAKDCSKEFAGINLISDQLLDKKNNQQVDIRIIYDKSQRLVIFMHNGFPFIRKTLDSLMYKNSTKDNDDDNTGRFGTGFMTSHTLSRVVKIQAPFYQQAQSSFILQYIEATIFREGKTDKQLRQEFMKMEKSKKTYAFNRNNPNHKWTTFTYKITNDTGIRSAELGIQSFRENITKVLLFCNEIRSIQINDEKPFLFSQIQSFKQIKPFYSKVFFDLEEKTINQRKFIVSTVNEENSHYSQKMSIEHERNFDDKKLQYSIAFEVNSKNQIIDQPPNSIYLFCTFPLIGSEIVQLPFLLNSPQFETLTERDGIVLEGDFYDSNKILTNTGLNCIIIDRSIQLFSVVLDHLCSNGYWHFSTFSNGLTNSVVKNPTINLFYDKLRTKMEKLCMISTSSNKVMNIKNILFLDFKNITDQKSFYSLVSQFYSNVASFNECIQWNGKLWDSLSSIDIDTFVEHIKCIGLNKRFSPQKNINYELSYKLFTRGLDYLTAMDINFLNNLYYFLVNGVLFSKIYDFQIILNSNNKFSYLNCIQTDSKYSEDLKKIMKLCDSWKDRIIHPKITTIKQIKTTTINDAVNELSSFLNSSSNNIPLLLSFCQFVLKENELRTKMYIVAKYFYNSQLGSAIYVSNIDPTIWNLSDSFLLIQINNLINARRNAKINETELDIYNIFYELYQKKFPYKKNFLVPNINLDLVETSELVSISNEIPQVIIDMFMKIYNFNNCIHPKITSVHCCKIITNAFFINEVNSHDFLFDKDKIVLDRIVDILSILPSKENQRLYDFQIGILSLAQLFLKIEIKSIETTITNELFWKLTNENVLSIVENKIKNSKNLNYLVKLLGKNENIIIDNLNIYYKLLSTNISNKSKNVMVPTIKGDFHIASEVSISKGISDELFDLFNLIKADFDIRDKLVHPKIECFFLNVIDIHEFLSLLCNNLKDDQLIHDSKIIGAISNIKSSISNSLSNENDPLLEKLYVANIKNRLNEIRNPNENDKARWPWELIQNAKDTIYSPSNTIGQKKVKIFIDINCNPANNNLYNEVIFSHNGLPFTENSYFGLLYKISQEKNSFQTTGRFGTGFVSTHVLSKIVEITGNKIDKSGEKKGFSVTIYREGLKDVEIINDFRKMQKSLQEKPQTYLSTSFKYSIKTGQSQECVNLGLDSLKRNIASVLINCNEIRFLNLNENGIKSRYYSTYQFIKKIENNSYYIYHIFNNKKRFQKYIVLFDEVNQLNISLQVTEKWRIINHNGNECLFSVFPLVGSSSHVLPFLINSPKFETVTERNALFLSGQSEINGQITNTGQNRKLLNESINMYKNLIKILIENNCPNLYELSRGLIITQKPYSSFDLDWYENNFLFKMRKILASNVYVHSNYGRFILLENAVFTTKEIKFDDLQIFIKLAQKYYVNIVCKKDTLLWNDKIWNTLNIVTIKDLINKVINDSSFITKDHLLYLNDLLGFIWKYDKNLLYDYKIIPDMNNKYHCLSREKENNEFKESKTVPDILIQIMESIQIPWKSNHMNNIINSIIISEDKVIDAENKIIEKIKQENALSIQLMKFVLGNNEKRQSMFDFVNELKILTTPRIVIKDINEKIWELADKYVLEQIVKKISNFKQMEVQKSIELFSKFIQFNKKFYKYNTLFTGSRIYPNAKYLLKKLDELKNKSNYFHDHLNPIMIQYFNKDFDNDILHPLINQFIKSEKDEHISDYLKIINTKISKLNSSDQLLIAESILSLVPSNSKLSIQNTIISIYKKLINPNLKEIVFPSNLYSKDLWNNCNKIIIANICSKIENAKNLIDFQKMVKTDNCFDILNSIYLLINEYKIDSKIIPNKNGIFMNKSNLFEDPKIGDDLFDCVFILEPKFNYKEQIADQRVQNISLSKFDVSGFYKQFYQFFIRAIKNPNKNEKVYELIKKITNIEDPSFLNNIASDNITTDQKVRNDILQDAHITFIKNRLRELDSPKPKDFERWPFELIQNANDSILSVKNDLSNQKVRIEFDFLDDKVIFRHNGSPFKYKSLMALLYQYSKGKSNNEFTTGRFGTGFMSTFILSWNVHISGDVEAENITGFDVMIYRDGKKKKELKNGVKQMEKSLKKNLPIKRMTIFEYDFKNTSQFYKNSVEAYNKGFLCLLRNIPQVLILNPTIESVVINAKSKSILYKANHEYGPIQTVTINSNNQIKTVRFLLFNSNEKIQSKNVSINCLLQIGSENNIFNSSIDKPLYISYPLIGVRNFNSPIIINSMEFEPEKERDDIIIQTDIENESYESNINKFIIAKSVTIFKEWSTL